MAAREGNTVSLIAGGDIGVREDADKIKELVLPELKKADLRFGQCEKLYSERAVVLPDPGMPEGPGPVYKRGAPLHPRLSSVFDEMDVVSMAGNHAMDWGADVMMDTIELLRGKGKLCFGAGKNIDEARKPVIVERNGVKLAFLAYCSVLADGHEATKTRPGCAPMRAFTYYQRGGDAKEAFHPGTPPRIITIPHEADLEALQDDIKRVKPEVDAVVVSMHWGIHHIPKTVASYQPIVAHAAIDAGADVIIGHHPHCLKAIEVYKGKVCFYSIGNFFTRGGRGGPEEGHDVWGFYYYHVDPECLPPHGCFPNPREARKSMLAKVVFSKKGVERVSFLPMFINPHAQPYVVVPGQPEFKDVLDYTEWLSEHYSHKFRVEGSEVVIETA